MGRQLPDFTLGAANYGLRSRKNKLPTGAIMVRVFVPLAEIKLVFVVQVPPRRLVVCSKVSESGPGQEITALFQGPF
jgi:hypothetical protein